MLSQFDGEPFWWKLFIYILLLDAVMASLVTFMKWAMLEGEIPIFTRRQFLYSRGDTSRKLYRFLSKLG